MADLKNTTISDTGFLQLPTGTTAQRPVAGSAGQMRFNTDTQGVEWYDDEYNSWFPVGVILPVATGGTVINITQGGISYRVHTFTSVGSSTLTVTRGGEVEFLIVAGGGGGGKEENSGNNYGGAGGGGAGGLLTGTTTVTPQAYTITVGAGGTGATVAATDGSNGQNSSALGFTTIGGGGGGGWQRPGLPGGSGGGGGSNNGATLYPGGSGTPGQGNAGAENWFVNGVYSGGGSGGGAAEPGTNRTQSGQTNNPGGLGLLFKLNGTMTTYATGGLGTYGGSTAQYGGSNGTANTGNGGAGGSYINAGNGGSGIVIIRYRTS